MDEPDEPYRKGCFTLSEFIAEFGVDTILEKIGPEASAEYWRMRLACKELEAIKEE